MSPEADAAIKTDDTIEVYHCPECNQASTHVMILKECWKCGAKAEEIFPVPKVTTNTPAPEHLPDPALSQKEVLDWLDIYLATVDNEDQMADEIRQLCENHLKDGGDGDMADTSEHPPIIAAKAICLRQRRYLCEQWARDVSKKSVCDRCMWRSPKPERSRNNFKWRSTHKTRPPKRGK